MPEDEVTLGGYYLRREIKYTMILSAVIYPYLLNPHVAPPTWSTKTLALL